jgi:transposase
LFLDNEGGVQMGEARRRHTKEFKIEAVRLAEGSKKGPGAVARELGITPELLRRWKRELQAAESEAEVFPGVRGKSKSAGKSEARRKLTSQDEEIRRLRRENARLREEREILKKAAAFFARESR